MGPQGDAGPIGPTGPTGPKGDKGDMGLQGPAGQIGSSIISFIPFVSNAPAISTTYADGSPAQVGIIGFGDALAADASGGVAGTVSMPGLSQCGVAIPINCILDTICYSVGNPAFSAPGDQTIHAFAMLATADGSGQIFSLHPETMAEVAFEEGAFHPEQVQTRRVKDLQFPITAEHRCIVVCGHYTTGSMGSTSYPFTHSASLLFK